MGDFWVFDIAAQSWASLVPVAGPAPAARWIHGFLSTAGKLYVVGGDVLEDTVTGGRVCGRRQHISVHHNLISRGSGEGGHRLSVCLVVRVCCLWVSVACVSVDKCRFAGSSVSLADILSAGPQNGTQ